MIQLATNGGLESGTTPWVLGSLWSRDGGNPNSGSWDLYASVSDTSTSDAYYPITISNSYDNATLSVVYYVADASSEGGTPFKILITNNSGTVLQTLVSSDGSSEQGSYTTVTADLTSYIGTPIRIVFRLTGNGDDFLDWYVDDLKINVGELEALWTFDSDFTDSSGKGVNLSTSNTPTRPAGKIGNCMKCVAASSQDAYANPSALSNISFSYAFWFNETTRKTWSGTTFNTLWSANSSAPGTYNEILSDQGVLKYATSGAFTTTGVTITAATWHHIAWCVVGTTAKLYVDGSLAATLTLNASQQFLPINIGSWATTAGVHGSQGFCDGQWDDFRVYSKTLSASDVLALFNAGSATVFVPSVVDGVMSNLARAQPEPIAY